MREIKINNKKIGDKHPTFIIAEMACSHNGSIEIAKKIIAAATYANADAINFQMTYLPDYMVPNYCAGGVSAGRDESDIYSYLKKLLWFWEKEWNELFKYARENNLIISTTCNDISSAKLAIKLNADIFQIHSSSLSEKNLVKILAKTIKPIALKIGGTSLEEMRKTINWIKEEKNNDIILLHGYQNYPTKIDDINLKFIPTLKNLFSLQVGFCDHTDGDSELALIVPLLAIPFGATVLEKHLTHDRNQKCEDFESALDPDDFKRFVNFLRKIEKTFGNPSMRRFSKDELKYRDISKKRIVAARSLKKGTILKETDIIYKRANSGLLPDEAINLLGKKLKKDLEKNSSLLWGDVE